MATGLFDELYMQLHLSGPLEDYGLTSDRRPSAIALRERDGQESLASYELDLDVMPQANGVLGDPVRWLSQW